MNNDANNPEEMFSGHCAFAVSTGKTDVEGQNHSLIKNGKKYVFSNPAAKFLFRILPNREAMANDVWNKKSE